MTLADSHMESLRVNRKSVALAALSLSRGALFPPNDPTGLEVEKTGAPDQIVVVEITQQPDKNRLPVGRVIRVLGNHMAPGMEIELAIQSHGIPNIWPPAVEAEAAGHAEVAAAGAGVHPAGIDALQPVSVAIVGGRNEIERGELECQLVLVVGHLRGPCQAHGDDRPHDDDHRCHRQPSHQHHAGVRRTARLGVVAGRPVRADPRCRPRIATLVAGLRVGAGMEWPADDATPARRCNPFPRPLPRCHRVNLFLASIRDEDFPRKHFVHESTRRR